MKYTERIETYKYHRFLDEAGDTTFYGKKRVPILGTDGVSKAFILGMLKINEPLVSVRERVIELQKSIEEDAWFQSVPSVQKLKAKNGYFLHAKNDVPEIRKMAFELIKSIDCKFEAIVGRKIYNLYENKHNGNEAEFYADLLSHLLKNKLKKYDRLVLNMAHRSKCTTHINLEKGKEKALGRSKKSFADSDLNCDVNFNVMNPTTEPLLNIADYFCWAIQRVFEKGDTRFYDYIADQVSVVIDIYDSSKYAGSKNYYRAKSNPLTALNQLQKNSP